MAPVIVEFGSAGIEKPLKDFEAINDAMRQSARITRALAEQQGISTEEAKKQGEELGLTVNNLVKYNAAQKRLAAESAKVARAQREAAIEAQKLAQAQQQVFRIISQFGLRVFRQFIDVISEVSSQAVEFERSLQQIQQISGATDAEIETLTNEIARLGSTTSGTLTQISQIAIQLSRAGFSAEETTEALNGITKAAIATNSSFATTGETVGTTIRQFGLFANDANRVGDLLVTTANNTNTSIQTLGQSLKFVGTEAAQSDQELRSTLTLLGLIGDAGLKSGQGGRNLAAALRAIKLNSGEATPEIEAVSRASEKTQAAFELLSTEFRNSDGTIADLAERLPLLKSELEGFEDVDRGIILNALFDTQGSRAVSAILSRSQEDIARVTNEIANFQSAADTAAEALQEGFAGTVTQIGSNLETLGTTTGEVVNTALQPLASSALAVLQAFNGLPEVVQKTAIVLGGLGTAFLLAVAAIAAYTTAQSAGVIAAAKMNAQLILNNLTLAKNQILTKASAVTTAAFSAAQALLATATGKATAAQIAQSKAILATAKSLGVAIGLIAAFSAIVNTFNSITKATRSASEGVRNVREAIEELDAITGNLSNNNEQFLNDLRRIREEQGLLQNSFDLVRVALGKGTAAQSAYNNEIIANGQVIDGAEAALQAYQAALARQASGQRLTREEIEQLNAILNTASDGFANFTIKTNADAVAKQSYLKFIENTQAGLRELAAVSLFAADATDRIRESSDAASKVLQQQLTDIQADRAVALALIEETIQSEEERQRKRAQVNIDAARQNIAILEGEIRARNQLLESGDLGVERTKEIEIERNNFIKQLSDQRIELAKEARDQQAEIERSLIDVVVEVADKAETALQQSYAKRTQIIADARAAGEITERQFNDQNLQLTQQAADEEVAITRRKIEQLQALPDPQSPEVAQERTDLLAEFSNRLTELELENTNREIEANQRLRDDKLAALQLEGEQQQLNNDIALDNLDQQSQAIDSQISLIQARTQLQQSQLDRNIAGYQAELKAIDQVVAIRKKLDQDVTLSLEERQKLQNEISKSGLQNIKTEEDATKARAKIEEQIFEQKLQAIRVEFEAARQVLELETAKNRILAQQQVLRAEIARDAILLAIEEAKLNEASAERLSLLQRQADRSQQLVDNAKNQLTSIDQLAAIERERINNAESLAVANLEAEKSNNLNLDITTNLAKQTGVVATNANRAARAFVRMGEAIDLNVERIKVQGVELRKQAGLLDELANAQSNLTDLQRERIELQLDELENQRAQTSELDQIGLQAIDRQVESLTAQLEQLEQTRLGQQIEANEKAIEAAEKNVDAAEAAIAANEALARLALDRAAAEDARLSRSGFTSGAAPRIDLVEDILLALGLGRAIGQRYQGGDVAANKPYWVGEDPRTGALTKYSELFIPKKPGVIIPAPKIRDYIGSMLSPTAVAATDTAKVGAMALALGLDLQMLKEMKKINKTMLKSKPGQVTNNINVANNPRNSRQAYKLAKSLLNQQF